jgi:hypothetical protein
MPEECSTLLLMSRTIKSNDHGVAAPLQCSDVNPGVGF